MLKIDEKTKKYEQTRNNIKYYEMIIKKDKDILKDTPLLSDAQVEYLKTKISDNTEMLDIMKMAKKNYAKDIRGLKKTNKHTSTKPLKEFKNETDR